MTYDELCFNYEDVVKIKESNLKMDCEKLGIKNVKGLYKNGKIAIDSTITNCEKKCILAEELGHHYTSCGNIIDLRYAVAAKQEKKARQWAAEHLIDFDEFKRATLLYNTP